jgi:hypothetical protein
MMEAYKIFGIFPDAKFMSCGIETVPEFEECAKRLAE